VLEEVHISVSNVHDESTLERRWVYEIKGRMARTENIMSRTE
jgi:hypothetical protein